ncbi:MAG: biotin--[acetyl-CoA-carboxylase] synthetase [Ilumatobacteraceae bacterium]|nr:biotin--[acetyl-CoA-carboxylase] synthetase [Ilumatobacteraceae bacterium]
MQVVAETGSTNDDLLEAAKLGAPDRSVLATAHQTAGRGRLDRRWDAPPGTNLLVSLLFCTLADDPPGHLHELTQRVALSAVSAARSVAGVDATLKWPNDLLIGDRKLAGMLAQAATVVDPQTGRHSIGHVVVGIGLNVGWCPDDGARLGDGVHPLDVLAAMLTAYDQLPDDVHPMYRATLGTLGRQVRVTLAGPQSDLVGRAIDVGRDGRLTVLDDCAISHHLDTGDIVHLRTES